MTSWADEAGLRNWLVDYLVTTIGCSPEDVHLDAPLNELGIGSRDAVVLAGELSEMLGRTVSPVDFWQNPTINSLAHGLLNPDAEPAAGAASSHGSLHEPIAVIGLSCRLPGDIHGPDSLWQFLSEGRSAVGEVPDWRWQRFDDGTPETRAALARTTRWGSFLADVAAFDAEYFDISPSEADRIDPQQRLLLEVAVEALDHAGIPAESLQRTQTGVFAGACVSEYGFLASQDLPRIDAWTGTGGALSIIANRLSYFLDARGPSVTVDTACSSSLVAIHLACRSLRLGESDLALAAGVNLVLAPDIHAQLRHRRGDVAQRRLPAFDAASRRLRPRRGLRCRGTQAAVRSPARRKPDTGRGARVGDEPGRPLQRTHGTQPGRPDRRHPGGVCRRQRRTARGRLRRGARHRHPAR